MLRVMAEESCDCDRFHYGEEVLSAGGVSQEVEIILVARDYHSRERHGGDVRVWRLYLPRISDFGRAWAVKGNV